MPERWRRAAGWLAVLGGLVALPYALADRRPLPPDQRVVHDFVVTSTEDDGAGSLRDAIFSAARADGRARIQLPAARIALRSPLPPLVNREGVVVQGMPGASEIDAAALSSGAVLDIGAPDSLITGIAIRNAAEQAVLVRQGGVRITKSTFVDNDQAVHIAPGVGSFVIEDVTFTGNRIGLYAANVGAESSVVGCRFEAHGDAGIWVVQPDETLGSAAVAVTGNRFARDRISVVQANTPVTIARNQIAEPRDAGLVLLGGGAVVQSNRIHGGKGVGLIADGTRSARIEDNEIDNNQAIGVLVRWSNDALVRSNRLYGNGYGLAFVLGTGVTPSVGVDNVILAQTYDGVVTIGDSPVLRDNQVLNAGSAGLRILDYYTEQGVQVPSAPLLQSNRLEGSAVDEPVRGTYGKPERRREVP